MGERFMYGTQILSHLCVCAYVHYVSTNIHDEYAKKYMHSNAHTHTHTCACMHKHSMKAYLFFKCWMLPMHLKVPFTIMARRPHSASHSSMLSNHTKTFFFVTHFPVYEGKQKDGNQSKAQKYA